MCFFPKNTCCRNSTFLLTYQGTSGNNKEQRAIFQGTRTEQQVTRNFVLKGRIIEIKNEDYKLFFFFFLLIEVTTSNKRV